MKNNPLLTCLLLVGGITLLSFTTAWWVPVIWVILVSSMSPINLKFNILVGALAYGVVWLCMAMWMQQKDDANIIVKTGELLGGLSLITLLGITFCIGAFTGALSAWFGTMLGRLMERRA